MRSSWFPSCVTVSSLLLTVSLAGAAQTVRVTGGDCRTIQQAIDSLPPGGGEVIVEAGTYACQEFIHIDRDNVVLQGVGPATLLRVADGADTPAIVVGQRVAVPTDMRSGIRISSLAIDGNRRNQRVECFRGPCSGGNPLRNNGITLRRVRDALVENVTVSGAKSGGLVTELTCRRITVRGLRSSDNEFDGLAGYETEQSVFSGLELHDNLAAGISIDIGFHSNIISDAVIVGSGSHGIFMRDSRDNTFTSLRIRISGSHGVFCAQVDADATKPCAGNTFNGLVVSDSTGAGFRVNDASCVNNLLDASQFFSNAGGCVSEAMTGLVQRGSLVCR
jgi:hypothetical protein